MSSDEIAKNKWSAVPKSNVIRVVRLNENSEAVELNNEL